jgi:hypothetical protein
VGYDLTTNISSLLGGQAEILALDHTTRALLYVNL